MALRQLTRITIRATDGLDHHFYVDLGNMPPGESSFLDTLFPDLSDGVQHASKHYKLSEFAASGYYDGNDLAAIKDALAKSTVAIGDSPTPPNPRPVKP